MNARGPSQAEETAALLFEAKRTGSPVLIPGAFERRINESAASLRDRIDSFVADPAPAAAAPDRARLEREREGGGAPRERVGKRPPTWGSQLWQTVLHPMHLSAIWRRSPSPAR